MGSIRAAGLVLTAVVAFLAPSVPAAGQDATAYLDASVVPWVPTPSIRSDMAPGVVGESCIGATALTAGPVPPGGEWVRISAIFDACVLASATLQWSTGGSVYQGVVDAVTMEVTQIVLLVRSPPDGSGLPDPRSRQEGDPWAPSTWAPGRWWVDKQTHASLHFWSKTGSGNEDVVENFNYRYAGEVKETTRNWSRCGSDGIWVMDWCDRHGDQAGTRGAATGDFHASWGSRHQHWWGAAVYPTPAHGVHGECSGGGDRPWWYGIDCQYGAGNKEI